MDGKFQEIMDMPYNLMSRMATPNGRMLLIIDLEIEQIKEYQVFKDHGKVVYEKGKIINALKEHQEIRVHFVFDVKHCEKFKTWLVTDGYLNK